MKSVVLYARESNHAGAEASLERQREKLKAFCEEKGYAIADEVSTIGSRQDSMPALKKAIECAKNTEGKTLLIAASNRVVGTFNEVSEISKMIKDAGVAISTMDNSFETVLVASTLAAFDDEE